MGVQEARNLEHEALLAEYNALSVRRGIDREVQAGRMV